ncbi:MAG: radical SAM protein [Elusimicrobia bacterium]|nr:radical SAM protein [Elusimicrobiota bacterium]
MSEDKKQKKELSTEEWKEVLKGLAEVGCLYLVFTGGEPLLREDLSELCKYATDLNFDIRIFTTGITAVASHPPTPTGFGRAGRSQVTGRKLWDEIKELKNTNVSKIEISFYGRKEIHNKITRNPDSFDRTLDFAKKLKDEGFRVKLKTSLMKENFMEMEYIKTFALKNGFEYSFDPVIAPRNDGDQSNLKHRLSLKQIRELFDSFPPSPYHLITLSPEISPDFFCGAGKNLVGINPYGEVYSCIQIPVSCGNLRKNAFAQIWKNSEWLQKWREMSIRDVKICSACSLSNKCNRCPGLALLEDGGLLGPSKLACNLTKNTPQKM